MAFQINVQTPLPDDIASIVGKIALAFGQLEYVLALAYKREKGMKLAEGIAAAEAMASRVGLSRAISAARAIRVMDQESEVTLDAVLTQFEIVDRRRNDVLHACWAWRARSLLPGLRDHEAGRVRHRHVGRATVLGHQPGYRDRSFAHRPNPARGWNLGNDVYPDHRRVVRPHLPRYRSGVRDRGRFAERAYKDYPGMYDMVEIAQQDWGLLPTVNDPSATDLVTKDAAVQLKQKGYIPGLINSADANPDAQNWSGWSATPPLVGPDGNTHRFVYLHVFKPQQPALN